MLVLSHKTGKPEHETGKEIYSFDLNMSIGKSLREKKIGFSRKDTKAQRFFRAELTEKRSE